MIDTKALHGTNGNRPDDPHAAPADEGIDAALASATIIEPSGATDQIRYVLNATDVSAHTSLPATTQASTTGTRATTVEPTTKAPPGAHSNAAPDAQVKSAATVTPHQLSSEDHGTADHPGATRIINATGQIATESKRGAY